jgi:hypothetical protein
MSVVNDTNKDHVLSYEGLEDVVAKIKNTFVRNTKQASDVELGLIKALDNTDVQLNELQGHDPDGNNYPVQIISDGTAFVNMPKPETVSVVDEKVKNEVIADDTKPYFLLGQPSQNITSKASTSENCFIKDGAIYSSSTKVLTEANLEDSERVQRDDNTWSYVHFDSDGFMGVDVPTIPSSLKNPHALTIQGNGTTIDSYDGSTAKTVNITPASIGAASTSDVEGSLYKTIYANEKETSNPGILVKTSVDETSNAMMSVKITGNAYCANDGTKPILTVLEFYNYYNGGRSDPRIIDISGTHFGADLGTIKLFNYDSKVCLWISQTGNFQSFNVFINWTNPSVSGVKNNVNVVESLTKSNVPSTATYLVEFTPKIVAYDGDATTSNGGHTHTINATSSTTEVAAKIHNHTVTATGNVSSTFTGTQTTTGNNTGGTTVASSEHTHDISGSIIVSGQRDTTNKRVFNVSFSFSGSSSATASTTEVAAKTHSHTVTATGTVSSTFTGTSADTSNNTSGATVASSGHTHTTSNDGSHSHTI